MPLFCINLDRRTDRWQHATHEFRTLGISVQRFSAITEFALRPGTLSKPEQSLIVSNLAILRNLNPNTPVGIFEDDVYFLPDRFPRKTLENMTNELPNTFGLVYWGAHLFGDEVKHIQVSPHLIRLLPPPIRCGKRKHVQVGGTHAVIFSPAVVEFISTMTDDILFEHPWDVFLSKEIIPRFKCFMANPAFAFQREDISDLAGGITRRKYMIRNNEQHLARGIYRPSRIGRIYAKLSGEIDRQKLLQQDSGVRLPDNSKPSPAVNVR